ncbi:uncharacterized protein LOC131428042 [Malaya genurostris]|uniref:uncharacterized protein LOC131428042 n=1 Tax=Malaya genurostris TaxID=325434 RepID=UPI0026F39250|nr:uncharacterized protein LOC131428042 [Malaya genurostris]
MSTVQLPPEIWDRIFDYLPFQQQLQKAVVCRAWNKRVAYKAILSLSCSGHNSQNLIYSIRNTIRNYKNFKIELLRTEQEYLETQHAVLECSQRFNVQTLSLELASSVMLEKFVDDHYNWIRTVRNLCLQLVDGENLPVDLLAKLTNLRKLRLLNITDANANWTKLLIQLSLIRALTIDAAWHYNDEALDKLIESVSNFTGLVELTIRSNDSACLTTIASNLIHLEKLSLVRLTIRREDRVLDFPSLKHLNFDVNWFVFDSMTFNINAPLLRYLRISKKIVPFVQFTDRTKIQQMDLFGFSISSSHSSFSTVETLGLTTQEPANQESILKEMKLFPNILKLTLKVMSKDCSIEVPCAASFQHITCLHLNNFVLRMQFFEEIAQHKILQHLTLEECNFSLNASSNSVELSHLNYFRVKRVSLPMSVDSFPVVAFGQPPIELVDKIRTHLWRNDHFNVFSSKWD